MTKALKNDFFPLRERQGGKERMSFFLAAALCIAKSGMHLICISKNIFWANVKFICEPQCQAIATHAFHGSCITLTVIWIIWGFLSFIIKQTGPVTRAEAGNGRASCNSAAAQTSCWMLLPMFPKYFCTSLFPLQLLTLTVIVTNTQSLFYSF